jgi:hypothetical protein
MKGLYAPGKTAVIPLSPVLECLFLMLPQIGLKKPQNCGFEF